MRVVQDIVSVAGEVVNSRADNEDYEGGNFMRIKVKVDLTKPLGRGRKMDCAMVRKIGRASNTNACLTFVIGVVKLLTMIKDALFGSIGRVR